ncbi:hypothetical protein PTW37_06810 [Arthrobacter agilis]|uniref:hypothetical protein n=1 Tax=Arthrobacter agilis TaxID=37921 RepID=UPI0023668881|nr:hypothetical protein [Arthrobacter agilis]WDF34606.1 hypothetical protein PTW37_06810 [Arthrobacter agilis]
MAPGDGLTAGTHGSVRAPSASPSELPVRGRVTARGTIERITIAPATATPSFSALARLDRNAGHEGVHLVWMGQRRVPGVEAGVELRFEGMMSRVGGTPTVYNPRYEIIGRPDEQ